MGRLMDSPGSELKPVRDELLRESSNPKSPTLTDAKRKVVMIVQSKRDLSGNIHTLGFIPVCGRFPKRVLSSSGQRHIKMQTGYGVRKLHPSTSGPLTCYH
ncbi:hypothetical protein CR513_55079, partial [Mucuna pruriens]